MEPTESANAEFTEYRKTTEVQKQVNKVDQEAFKQHTCCLAQLG